MSNGNNGAKMAEELHPHPVMEQLNNVQYCINSPPPWGTFKFLKLQDLSYIHREFLSLTRER